MPEPTPQDTRERRAVVLLSGGLDSAVVAALLRRDGWALHALTVDYGQRHRAELDAARAVAERVGVAEHLVLPLDLTAVGGSALTDPAVAVPRAADPLAPVGSGIPPTYVPARNLLFLSLAAGLAEARGAAAVAIGVNAVDYSGYPDCRPEFLDAFERVLRVGTRAGVEGRPLRVLAPLLQRSKAEILALAGALGVPVERTVSCYDPTPEGAPCGGCEACRLRARAAAELAARPSDSADSTGRTVPGAEDPAP